jgi:hypothetical protein
MEAYLTDGTVPSADVLRKALRKGTIELRLHTGALRLVLQEQGRAAGARCGSRLSAGAHRRASIKTVDADGEPIGERKLRRRAVLGAGVQGHQRRLRRADLHPRLLGRADQGRLGAELDARQAREDRPHGRDVRQGSQSDRGGARRRHHRAGVAGRHRDRRYAVRFARTRWCWSACAFRTRSSACR